MRATLLWTCTCLSIINVADRRIHIVNGGIFETRTMEDDLPLEAAKMELMVLRAALPLSSSADASHPVSFGRDTLRLTSERAAVVLSEIPKPVVCTATESNDRTLLIDCKSITTVDEDNTYLSVMGMISQHFGQDASLDTTTYIRVVRRGESRRFSLAAIRRWSRDYVIPHDIAFGHWPAGTTSRNETAEEALEILHIDEPDSQGPPPGLPVER